MPHSTIERIELDLLKVPLKTPYKLAFGSVEAFDTLLVTVTLTDGRTGIGEATILTGYTDETLDQSWRAAHIFGAELAGAAAGEVAAHLSPWLHENPFTVTAFVTSVEMALGHPTLRHSSASVPLLAILSKSTPAAIEAELEELLAAGYRTIKVKAGWDVDADLTRVRLVQRLLNGRAIIRIDANQGYSQDDGCRFARSLDPAGIELFEQPCAADDWDAALAVKRVASVPMMLDESICDIADVERAAALGAADFIKLKLMKLGSIDRLEQALAHVHSLGLIAVLGNGVATEIGCWMEACVSAKMVATAGEMNGFQKQLRSLVSTALRVEHGCLQMDLASPPSLDAGAVAAARVAREEFRATYAKPSAKV
jgi:L-Ala-D/L-Glu epimerase / N-acetyl-D-glutamate racemase